MTAPGAAPWTWLASEPRGDPLAAFPGLRAEGRPYNLWLTERVLQPALAGWAAPAARSRAEVSADVARACARCRLAFRAVVPAASAAGDPALLAALGVTANLQRTLAVLAERLWDRGVRAGRGRRPALSRLWCGLLDYPEGAGWFSGAPRPPLHPGRIDPRRRDPRHLANALWCPPSAPARCCDLALERLRWELRARRPLRRTGRAGCGRESPACSSSSPCPR